MGADLAHDAGAFKSGYPPTGGDCRRRSERWRARDTVKIAWMNRRVRYADANLIWPKRCGGAVFDPKHSRRFSEFVVDDSSHVNLQRLAAQPAARDRRATGRLSRCPGGPAAVITGLPELAEGEARSRRSNLPCFPDYFCTPKVGGGNH